MKRFSMLLAIAFVAALALFAIAGCGNQQAASSSASESESAAAATEQTQEEIISELKEAISKDPTYKSVTLTETSKASFVLAEDAEGDANEADQGTDVIESKTVYKFDESSGTLKTSMTSEIDDIKIQYFSDGDEAVCVTDGPVYSGTTEQFDMDHFAGIQVYLTLTIGDINTLLDCLGTVTKEQQGDTTVYTLNLDPQKYIDTDEVLTILADSGDPVQSAVFTFAFDKEGRIVTSTENIGYAGHSIEITENLSDFDSTVVDPMPEADKAYEEMEDDIAAKYETLEQQMEAESAIEE